MNKEQLLQKKTELEGQIKLLADKQNLSPAEQSQLNTLEADLQKVEDEIENLP